MYLMRTKKNGLWSTSGGLPAVRTGLGYRLTISLFLFGGLASTIESAEIARPQGLPTLVVTRLPVGTEAEQAPSASGGMLPNDWGPGAQIVLLRAGDSPRILTAQFASACDPSMHFDGTRLLFSGKRTADDDWNIYEISIDGSGLRQITRGLGDCRDPSYQSDYYQISDEDEAWRQITFVNIRAGERNEFGSASGTSLHSCRLDGTQVNRLTFNLSSDRDPELTWDGRLVYASWQRRTLKYGATGRVVLLGINVDGTDAGPVVVDAGRRIKHMPCATTTGLLIFVEADRVDWDGAGMLSCVSLRRPLHTYQPLTKPSEGLFHSPSALPDGAIVVSRRPAEGTEGHALYRFDPTSGQMELMVQEPNYHLLQAQAVAVRQQPDGRSSSINETDPNGKLYCLSVYTNDLKDPAWMPSGSVEKLRVIEGVPHRKSPGTMPATDASADQPAARRILGEVPVASDGSFHVEIPANTAIELQLLDRQGVSLRSCGWIWTRNHFNQGCIGCHEDPELTPENTMVDALEQSAASVGTSSGESRTIDFRRDLMPLIGTKCLPCHAQPGSPPDLTAGKSVPRDWTDPEYARAVYDVLLAEDRASDLSTTGKGKRYVNPGQARTSPLAWHLAGRNLSRPWDGDRMGLPVKPIPSEPPISLSEDEKMRFYQWIDLGAPWEASIPPDDSSSSK